MPEDNKIIAELVLEGANAFKAELKTATDTAEVEKEFKQLNSALDLSKQKLKTLTAGSSEFKKLEKEIKGAEIATSIFKDSTQSLKKELRSTTEALQIQAKKLKELEKAGLDGTIAYKELKKSFQETKQKVGELKDDIGDLNNETSQLGSDTKHFDKLIRGLNIGVSAFGAIQGAQSLFGVESAELEKKLVQLNAIMAISNGLQQIQEELTRKDSIAKNIASLATGAYTAVVGASTGAMKLFKIALASTGIGLLVVGLGVLIANFGRIKDAIINVFPSFKDIGKAFNEVKAKIESFVNKAVLGLINGFIEAYNSSELLRKGIGAIGAFVVSLKDVFVLQFKQIGNVITTVFNAIKAGLKGENPFDVIKKGFEQAGINSKEAGKKIADNFKKPIKDELKKITAFDLFPDSKQNKEAGQKAGQEVSKGINEGISKGISDNPIEENIFRNLEESIKFAEDLIRQMVVEDIDLGINPQTDQAINEVFLLIKDLKEKLKKQENQVDLILNPKIEKAEGSNGNEGEKTLKQGSRKVQGTTLERANGAGRENGLLGNQFFGLSGSESDKATSIYSTLFDIQNKFGELISQAQKQRTDKEIANLENQKARGIISEKKYQKELAKIKNDEAKKQRRADVIQAFLAVPLAFLQALKTGGLISAGIAGALALANATLVASAPLPKFKHGGLFKGGGVVVGQSHDKGGVNAELEGGEFVIKKKAVNRYGVNFLKSVNDMAIAIPQRNVSENNFITNREMNLFNANFAKLEDKLHALGSYAKEGNGNGRKELEQLIKLNEKMKTSRGY